MASIRRTFARAASRKSMYAEEAAKQKKIRRLKRKGYRTDDK